jgi:hypothetical protein
MLRSLFTRRGVTAVAVAAIGMSGMSLALAGTAGATAQASLIVGSGSQTSYTVMTGLSDLFNNSPGCDLTTGTGSLGLACGTNSFAAGTVGGEQGFNVAAENPYNDYTVQAPAVGSGNGRSQLLHVGAGAPDTTPAISYARSSSGPGSSDNGTENFVKYATDGVSWVTFNEFNGAKTPQAKVLNISLTQLQQIYAGTLSCSVKGGGTAVMNWECLGAKTSNHIDCYVAQTGSGTYSTWQTAMGFTKGVAPGCTTNEASGTQASHINLAENQMSYVSQQPDAAQAIYFMSFGRYQTTCNVKGVAPVAGIAAKAVCNGVSQTTGSSWVTEGSVNTIAPNKTSIQGTGGGAGVTFPITRGLYNVYLNSTSANPSNQATLNLASEYGFLCKQDTNNQTDPATGVLYRTEIENTILASGFFPLDTGGNAFTFVQGTHAASITDPGYTPNVTQSTLGYCNVTDG